MSRPLMTVIPLLLLLSGSANAHLLKLFAYVEGTQIHGSVYFAGGGDAAGAAVTVSRPEGPPLASLTTDAEGGFSYPTQEPGAYRLQADTGDGHRAEWLIRATEFAPTEPLPVVQAGTESRPTDAIDQAVRVDERTAALIEQAMARQIGPLRAALQRSDERARLSDILGGIGFIFGLAGITLWWRARRDRTGQ